jgi:hypothetical protein
MDNLFEKKATFAIAQTFDFVVREKDCKCKLCGARLSFLYVGEPINERMIKHSNGCHPKSKGGIAS